jgi:hypothetical protein
VWGEPCHHVTVKVPPPLHTNYPDSPTPDARANDAAVAGFWTNSPVAFLKHLSSRVYGHHRNFVVKAMTTIVAAVMAACTYGPMMFRATVTGHTMNAATSVFAVTVRYEEYRDPTGIAAFPDGGSARIVAEGVAYYACDTARAMVRRIAALARPKRYRGSFNPGVGPWVGDSLWLSLRGYTSPSPSQAAFAIEWYVVDNAARAVATAAPTQPSGAAASLPPFCESRAIEEARASRADLTALAPQL